MEGARLGRGGNQAEKQPQCQAQQTPGSSRAKRVSACITSFPLGPISFLDVGYLGRSRPWASPLCGWQFLERTDSSRLSDDYSDSWGYGASARKELGAASLCDHHTECGRTKRGLGWQCSLGKWSRKASLAGSFFLSRSC